MFWRKKTDNLGEKSLNSLEYEKCVRRMVEWDAKLESLSHKLDLLKTDVDNLRGRFNQRLKNFREEEKKEEAKDLNLDNTIYLG